MRFATHCMERNWMQLMSSTIPNGSSTKLDAINVEHNPERLFQEVLAKQSPVTMKIYPEQVSSLIEGAFLRYKTLGEYGQELSLLQLTFPAGLGSSQASGSCRFVYRVSLEQCDSIEKKGLFCACCAHNGVEKGL